LRHLAEVSTRWGSTLEYVEDMLRKQLVAAIGKEVSPADFAAYMRFHYRKVFKEDFAPSPFCFAVRRSDKHGPEGTLSIEEEVVGPGGDSNIQTPIVTMAGRSTSAQPMHFDLSASTQVSFAGERYLHAWLSHQFSGQSGAKLSLVSRARQFSSMLVLVGRIASATSFEPSYAAIVQNKDELTIPLNLSTIPTPKEFKDAIESLSPEMQSFAKAFRAMQLESTLFGILVVQIKPQLEKVLNLVEDSLTKEIKLTQDLMQLFIKYQIPSDLLSFDSTAGPDGSELVAPTAAERLEAVKGHVKAMHEMIHGTQEEEIAGRFQEESFNDPFGASQAQPKGFKGKGGAKGGGKGGAKGGAMPMDLFDMPMGGMRGAAEAVSTMAFGAAPPMQRACCFGAAPQQMAVPAPPPPPAAALCCSAAAPAPAAAPPGPQPQAATTSCAPNVQHWSQSVAAGHSTSAGRDFSQVPKEMDERFEQLDTDSALRPTIINPASTWTKKAQKALLASPTTSSLGKKEQKTEKDAAFDLLDALTKSGALPLSHASLHVVVAATHCFDKTVTETVVRDNINPIEKVERSSLIMASTVHQLPPAALINETQQQRVHAASPMLFLENQA